MEKESVINVTELARRLGVSHPAVSRAKKTGGKVKGIDLKDIAVYKANKIIGFSLDKLEQVQKAIDGYQSDSPLKPVRLNPEQPEPEYRENPRRNSSFLNIESVNMADLAKTVPSLAGMSPRVSIPIFTCSAAIAGGLLMYYATQQRPDIQPHAVAAGAALGGLTYAGSLIMAARFSSEDGEAQTTYHNDDDAKLDGNQILDSLRQNPQEQSDAAKIKPFKLQPLKLKES